MQISEEDAKFLAEEMGICWHEFKKIGLLTKECIKCGLLYPFDCPGEPKPYINFFTWEGFGKAWEWAKKHEWWEEFLNKEDNGIFSVDISDPFDDHIYYRLSYINIDLIGPALIPELVKFLRERDEKWK